VGCFAGLACKNHSKWITQLPELLWNFLQYIYICNLGPLMVAQWLRYFATNRKVAGSIPDGAIGIFH
jgi:hypothetical protein